MGSLLWGLYRAAMGTALVTAGPILLLRRGGHYLPTLRGRLGCSVEEGGGRGALWLHAVSVGEVGVAATLARALPPSLPLLVTTVTPTGQARARGAFAGRAQAAYLPFDLGGPVARFFARFEPSGLILVEGDYWPLLLREAGRRRLPVAVVNGRVGDSSFRRLRRLRPLLAPLFSSVGCFGVQSAEDGERLARLGVERGRIAVTGNLKYETPEPAADPALAAFLNRLSEGRPVLVAGSTMPGEEEKVLDAFAAAGGGGKALLVLAPRHPERWNAVAALLAARGVEAVRRGDPGATGRPAVLLLDSLGELAGLYRHAAGAFVGGTLVPAGGHNPLEAARFGVPVAAGPSMENFREIAAELDREAAWCRVEDAAGLARAFADWLAQPEAAQAVGRRGQALVEQNRGALDRTLAMLRPLFAW
jgi:3-deoxy-D-manno-octulosonic-acid transferase